MNGQHDYDYPTNLPSGIDKDTREKLLEHLGGEPKEDSKRRRKVNKELCDLLNKLADEGMQKTDILEYAPFTSKATLYYHLRGDCQHELETDINYDECGWIRVYADKGAPAKTLSVLYDCSPESARLHATGRCNHEDGIEPVSKDVMWENQKDTRVKADVIEEECPVCGDVFKYKEYKERTTCSTSCNSTYANRQKEKV